MQGINFQRTYRLDQAYNQVKHQAAKFLKDYLHDPGLFIFDDLSTSVTFTSERLIPLRASGRPCVMLIFSNPHPHSIRQGMFLSPNRRNLPNSFWQTMSEAGWFNIYASNLAPAQLRDIFLRVEYDSPFELIFYCYYAFPSDFPEDLPKIFSQEFFRNVIELAAKKEFLKTLTREKVRAVVTFNKGVFNRIAKKKITRYLKILNDRGCIRSEIAELQGMVPIHLTYPTGWRYHRNARALKQDNLKQIKQMILDNLT
ncbi:MAG: hypothetical protein A2V67_03125 [Deltaproteobacteria bacterium RBG_13_61_14]|nr:MAG: hypothetical protein A2V67_03125 [Deltaproteobacteria bacterium RBG_13_61_14]